MRPSSLAHSPELHICTLNTFYTQVATSHLPRTLCGPTRCLLAGCLSLRPSQWPPPTHPTLQENSRVCCTCLFTSRRVRLSSWRWPSEMRRMLRIPREGGSKLKYRSVFQKSVFPMVGEADCKKWEKLFTPFWGYSLLTPVIYWTSLSMRV